MKAPVCGSTAGASGAQRAQVVSLEMHFDPLIPIRAIASRQSVMVAAHLAGAGRMIGRSSPFAAFSRIASQLFFQTEEPWPASPPQEGTTGR